MIQEREAGEQSNTKFTSQQSEAGTLVSTESVQLFVSDDRSQWKFSFRVGGEWKEGKYDLHIRFVVNFG